jgi:hypothetical protein
MSALGQKQTSTHVRAMSALPPKADILRCSEERRYSITSSARERSVAGTSRSIAFAVLRLITSSNFVDCTTELFTGRA